MRNIRRTILWTLLAQALVAALPAAAQTSDAAQTPPAKPAAPAGTPNTTPQATDQPADKSQAKTLGQVSVTGIRGSLEAARDVKRDSTQIVDAVVADDIGKLPDTNVAESLGRVSGVQLVRGMGEGSDILVRGLHQNVYLYNGREIYDATGRGGVGLDQLGTSTYGLLTLVPSQLISQLSVTKLASADQVAGALGGIIDINTRMPLYGDGDQNVVAVSGTYSGLAHKAGGSGFALLSARSKDDRWGAMVAATYSHADVVQQGLDTFSGYAAFKDPANPSVTRFGSTDMRAQNIDDDRDKTGVSAILQWRPASGVEITADTFYSHQQADRDRYWLAFNPSAGLSNAVYSNNILVAGRSTSPVLSNTEVADIDADVWSSALKASFRAGDHLDGSAEVSFDHSTAEYHQLYMRLQPAAGINSVTDFDLRNGDFGSFNVSGVNLSDPSQMSMSILFDNDYRARTNSPEARTDWTWSFDSDTWKSLDFGLRYNQLDTKEDPLRADIRPVGGIPATELGDFLRIYSNNNFMNGQFAGLPRSYLASYRSALTGCAAFTQFPQISQDPQCLNGADNALAYAGTYDINEDFYEGYAKLDWETQVGSLPLSGNVGMRYVQRHLDSRGNLLSGAGEPLPTDYQRTDREWLPSAIAKLDISDSLLLRGGVARVVAFPNTQDLNNGVTLNNNAVFQNGVQITPGTGSGGAPGLDPFKATQYDLSLEYYYSDQGLLSAGLFYKDVSTFIVQQQSAESYGGVNYLINREVNGDHATVQGAELLAQVPFTFLPDPLKGFGMVATYTFIDSTTPIKDVTGRSLTFPGLSKHNTNLILYYETGPFSARVAYNWRDQYLVGLSAAATGIYNDKYSDLAASVSYNFTDRLSLQLEASNLLNSQQRTYDGSPEGLRTNVVYGRNYMATATWRF
ncbi:TonB-dependent receptor [Dyella sedimenti]|uniref:TonB-dependent receptor n=1 Tax=Dyella sedimenti TaxID=2919947 RepID=UPI001FAB01D8|nr:TonB-dependent receptor [Dyella sedimenti]